MIRQCYKETFATMEAAQAKIEELKDTDGIQVVTTACGNLRPGFIDLEVEYWLMEDDDDPYIDNLE